MTTMYDAVRPLASRIPTTAPMVAGYVDGIEPWTDAEWNRFPNAVKIRIAVFASTDDGHVLDVETQDATPAQAPSWVRMRLASGLPRATIYCNRSNWLTIQRDLAVANMADKTDYWLADPTGTDHIVPGSIGTQWLWTPNYDQSTMMPSWWPLGGPVMPNAACVAFKRTATGKGYYMVGADGGVFTEGDAKFHGAIPGSGIHINAPVIAFETTPDEGGYWLITADYGVFTFGNAPYLGHP